ncbi:hypothetical protein J3458_000397 [Metarhizium acridum]|uniref:uncharacterized protein n=1 Tax=Metarhizium acridum TaxID=92637 RepID=UPI001C6C7F09|nr:hypothetical protein J3458_000397 [Metarhizium acridum]
MHHAGIQSNLSKFLEIRFQRDGNKEDIEKAVKLAETSASAQSAVGQSRLASALHTKSKSSKGEEGLKELEKAEKAVSKAIFHMRNVNLSHILTIASSIYKSQDALEHAKGNLGTERANILKNLGTMYEMRGKKSNRTEAADMDKALKHDDHAFEDSLSPPLISIIAAHKAGALCAGNTNWDRAKDILQRAIERLRKATPRWFSLEDHQYVLSQISGLSSLAATALLISELAAAQGDYKMMDPKKIVAALKLYETGRGIISSIVMDFKAELVKEEEIDGNRPQILQLRREEDEKEAGQVEKETKKRIPTFVGSLDTGTILNLAKYGPIVYFNVNKYRQDAIIITKKQVLLKSLEFSCQDLKDHVRAVRRKLSDQNKQNKKLISATNWLWTAVVNRILEVLGSEIKSPSPSSLPRIWWVTSGLLELLPLHAANDGQEMLTMSRVVSSYIPTLTSLKYVRDAGRCGSRPPRPRPFGTESAPKKPTMLVIMKQHTVGKCSLDVEEEYKNIESSMSRLYKMENPTKERVKEALKSANMVHFSCHGKTDAEKPSRSGLLHKEDKNNES